MFETTGGPLLHGEGEVSLKGEVEAEVEDLLGERLSTFLRV